MKYVKYLLIPIGIIIFIIAWICSYIKEINRPKYYLNSRFFFKLCVKSKVRYKKAKMMNGV